MPIEYAFSENSWGNFFYKVYNTPKKYGDAKAQCESDGAFLAIPRSQAENDFLYGLLPNDHFWIGINDIEQEGQFVAVDGREISWTYWTAGQPNGGTLENAATIDYLWNGQWHDRNENSFVFKFVCSIHIEGTYFPLE